MSTPEVRLDAGRPARPRRAVTPARPGPAADAAAGWYRIRYRCPDCGHEWEEEWSCPCDSECGACGCRDITALTYEEADPV